MTRLTILAATVIGLVAAVPAPADASLEEIPWITVLMDAGPESLPVSGHQNGEYRRAYPRLLNAATMASQAMRGKVDRPEDKDR